jgi:cytochrome c-type biogenesis protein CcmH/NrfG
VPTPSTAPVEAASPTVDPSASAAAPALPPAALASAVVAASSPPAPVASDSPSPRTLVAQAEALLGRGSYAHAIEVAKRATAADPTNPEGWLTLGGAYGAQGNTSQARAAYHKCVDLAKGGGVRECKALLAP